MVPDVDLPPSLPERYHAAARSALAFVFDEHSASVRAVTIGGSIVRGQGDETSDLDIWVVVAGDRRQRVQRWFDGVRCELFLNPEERILRYFAEEAPTGRVPSIGLTLDGVVVHDPEGVAERLRAEARAVLDAGPTVSGFTIDQQRYGAVDSLDNARDVHDRDRLTSAVFLADALSHTLQLAYLLHGRWVPRPKDRRRLIGEVCPEVVDLLERYESDPSPDALALVLDEVLGVSTFFEWESPYSSD